MPHFRLTRVTWKRFWFNALLYHINPLKFWVRQMKCEISPVARVVRVVVPLDKAFPPPPPHDNFAHKEALSRCKFTNVHANEMQFYYVIRHTINILHLPLKWNEWQKLLQKRRNCNLINKCIALVLKTAIFVIFL